MPSLFQKKSALKECILIQCQQSDGYSWKLKALKSNYVVSLISWNAKIGKTNWEGGCSILLSHKIGVVLTRFRQYWDRHVFMSYC